MVDQARALGEAITELRLSEDADALDIAAFVGLQIRERRRFLGMTIAEMAKATGISISNLSKIENAQVSPSLASLDAIAIAIGVSVSSLFHGFKDEGQLHHIPAGKGVIMARPGKSGGHDYELLFNSTGQMHSIQPYLVTLRKGDRQRAVFSNKGTEFLYMLEGSMAYRYGTRVVEVQTGDALIFDARTAHGPETVLDEPARFLALFALNRNGET